MSQKIELKKISYLNDIFLNVAFFLFLCFTIFFGRAILDESHDSMTKVYYHRLQSRQLLQMISLNHQSISELYFYQINRQESVAEEAYRKFLMSKGIFKAHSSEIKSLSFMDSEFLEYKLKYDMIKKLFKEFLQKPTFDNSKIVVKHVRLLTEKLSEGESKFRHQREIDFNFLRVKATESSYFYYAIVGLLLVAQCVLLAFSVMRHNLHMKLDQQRTKLISNSHMAALGEFSASVAHEINNPLTVILWRLKNLKKFLPSEDERAFKQWDSLLNQTNRIDHIVRGIKTLTKDGEQDDMCEFKVSEILIQLNDLLESKKVSNHFNFTINNHSDELIKGRQVQLIQVITNLVNNSIYAIKELDTRWVKVESVKKNDNLIIKITDSGPGIPPKDRAKLFDLFYTTKGNLGTGIGLSLSKQIIVEHGGDLVYNPSSFNTQFVITLPISSNQKNRGIRQNTKNVV